MNVPLCKASLPFGYLDYKHSGNAFPTEQSTCISLPCQEDFHLSNRVLPEIEHSSRE